MTGQSVLMSIVVLSVVFILCIVESAGPSGSGNSNKTERKKRNYTNRPTTRASREQQALETKEQRRKMEESLKDALAAWPDAHAEGITLNEVAERHNVNNHTLYNRIKRKWKEDPTFAPNKMAKMNAALAAWPDLQKEGKSVQYVADHFGVACGSLRNRIHSDQRVPLPDLNVEAIPDLNVEAIPDLNVEAIPDLNVEAILDLNEEWL